MTVPVQTVAEGVTYARMTVSLNGWGVETVGDTFYLECALLLGGEEGSLEAALHAVSLLGHIYDKFAASVFQLRQVVLCKCGPRPVFQSYRYERQLYIQQGDTVSLPILKERDVDSALWFREIYGGPHAFGLEIYGQSP